ncbi:translation protein SH3-like domain-containing protein [Haematococcus lacustris]
MLGGASNLLLLLKAGNGRTRLEGPWVEAAAAQWLWSYSATPSAGVHTRGLHASSVACQQAAADPGAASHQASVHPALLYNASLSHAMALQPVKQKLKPAEYTPWVFSRHTSRPRGIVRRMHFMMQSLEEEQVRNMQLARPIPSFKAGDILEVRMVVPEASKKVVTYKGLCIGRYNKGIRSAFKLYNVWPDSGGFVQHIPLYMPDLLDVKVVGHRPVHRNKLYYVMDRKATDYRFQDSPTFAARAEVGVGAQQAAESPGTKGSAKSSKAKKQ